MLVTEPTGTHFLLPAVPGHPYWPAAKHVTLALHRPGFTRLPSAYGFAVRVVEGGIFFGFTSRVKSEAFYRLDSSDPQSRIFETAGLGELIDNTPKDGCNLVVAEISRLIAYGIYRLDELDSQSWQFVDFGRTRFGPEVEIRGRQFEGPSGRAFFATSRKKFRRHRA